MRTARAMGIDHRGRLLRPRRRRPPLAEADLAVRLPGDRRPTPTSAPPSPRRRGPGRRRRRPSRLRIPVRVRRLRPGGGRRRAHLGRPPADGHRRHGVQGRRPRSSCGRPGCPPCPSITLEGDELPDGRRPRGPGLAPAGQGVGRRGRAGHARGGRSGRACGRRWPAPAGRPRPPSATAPSSSSATCATPATSRCRCWRTPTATPWPCSSGSAASSAGTRRSSRRPLARPCPAELRARLTEAAVAAARAVGYVNAGTVEFVLDRPWRPVLPRDEHPPAGGAPGDRGGDRARPGAAAAARRRGRPAARRGLRRRGPRAPGTPSRPGSTPRTRPRAGCPPPGPPPVRGGRLGPRAGGPAVPIDSTVQLDTVVRVDSGVESGSVVSPHYDPMLAKVIAHAPTRTEAAAALAAALARARIHGVTTNRDLLVRTSATRRSWPASTDTGFLDRHGLELLATPLTDAGGGAPARAGRRPGRPGRTAAPGRRSSPPSRRVPQQRLGAARRSRYHHGDEVDRRGLPVRPLRTGPGRRSTVDGDPVRGRGRARPAPGSVVLTTDGVTRRYRVERVGPTAYVDGPTAARPWSRRTVPAGRRPGGGRLGPGPDARERGAGGGVDGRRGRRPASSWWCSRP